ncbi:MAG: hypothetical protein JWQ02_2361, partial [Capsulimonas sp.]|nr:hypothetical protein [Capsulimonas sp.]
MSDALEQLDIFNADLDSEDLDDSLAEAAAPYLLETELPTLDVTPRPYQQEALAAWSAAGGRGMVVLP